MASFFSLRRRASRRLALMLAVLGGLGLAPLVLDAVLVAPHAVFIDHRSRTAQVYLVNTSATPEEVTVDLQFGYPVTDSSGNVSVQLWDKAPAGEPSAAEWIKAYPRRLVLNPGQRQVVRLLATPPADLPDGEYWARLVTSSRGATTAVAGGDSTMSAGLSVVLRTVSSVTYRKGSLHTGVTLDAFRAEARPDSLVAWLDLRREGTAAYLGTARIQLVDAERNRVVRDWDTPIAVYHAQHRRLAFPLDSVPPGRYTTRLELSSARTDLDARDVLPAAGITRSVELGAR